MIAVLSGELDIVSAPALREELHGLLRPGTSRLIIDLSAVRYADSSGIAVLVGTGRRAALFGGWLRLASLTPEVTKVLSITGLDRHLVAFRTVEEALTGRIPTCPSSAASLSPLRRRSQRPPVVFAACSMPAARWPLAKSG
ncbi:MAG TPA: STAS domain-containing protein [Streptosporangiaceae bacterium]